MCPRSRRLVHPYCAFGSVPLACGATVRFRASYRPALKGEARGRYAELCRAARSRRSPIRPAFPKADVVRGDYGFAAALGGVLAKAVFIHSTVAAITSAPSPPR